MPGPARAEARPSLGPRGLTWLASYPKSGNTWLRILLSSFHAGTATPEDINRLTLKSVLAESREEFSARTLLDSRLLSPRESEPLLAALYENWARESPEALFLKTHRAFTRLEDGSPVCGATARRAVYIVRDPRDVVISHACHFGLDCDAAIRILNDVRLAGR